MLNINKKTYKKRANESIDKGSVVMLWIHGITLCNVIFHQGKLSVRVGRNATGLKPKSNGGLLTNLSDDLISSRPGCRGDNILSMRAY